MPQTVLVLSQDRQFQDAIRGIYERAGYRSAAMDLQSISRHGIERLQPDLVVVATARGEDSVGHCRDLRRLTTAPLLIAAAEQDDRDEFNSLAAGADDYISTQRPRRALIARSERLLFRRSSPQSFQRVFRAGRLSVNVDDRTVTWEGAVLPVTRTEFELLSVLACNSHRVVRRVELLDSVWGSWYGDDHVVEVHLSRLRSKLRRHQVDAQIDTVRGVGYRLVDAGQLAAATELEQIA